MDKLAGQEMNVKKLCRKENITNEEDHSGFHLSSLLYLPLFFLFGSSSGDVRWWPCLTLCNLLETSRDLLSGDDSFHCTSNQTALSSEAYIPQGGAESLLWSGLLFALRLLPYGGWLSTEIQTATSSVLSPKPLSPVSPQTSVVHSVQPFPSIARDLLSVADFFSC